VSDFWIFLFFLIGVEEVEMKVGFVATRKLGDDRPM